MPLFEFAVALAAGDNTAFTVLTALRGLGYRELEHVERVDLLRLRLTDGAMSVDDCARALTRSEVVFNPNKHKLSIAAAGEGSQWEAVVVDKDDDTSALSGLLVERFAIRGLEQLECATAWRLQENDGPASQERLDWACRSLLANPYSQRYSIRRRPAYASVKP
jgi:phosphoribosylformylglycinamidine (FGAM) synthase PurS component